MFLILHKIASYEEGPTGDNLPNGEVVVIFGVSIFEGELEYGG